MEKMLFPEGSRTLMSARRATVDIAPPQQADWRETLPTLICSRVVLRELRASDAPSLFALLSTSDVARFVTAPPQSVDGFSRFIAWAERQRAAGTYACFAVTLKGYDTAVGLFQVRETEAKFATAEWGFALGSTFWGTGIFQESAELVLEFAFDVLGVHRLEARVAVRNGRGIGALQKLGAVHEGILRKSFSRNGEFLDQALYAIVADEWRDARHSYVTALSLVH